MKVEIIKDDKGQAIGWSMEGENKEEINKLCDIRNLQFFGYGDTAIRYNGRKGGDDEKGNPGVLSWIQKSFHQIKNNNTLVSQLQIMLD